MARGMRGIEEFRQRWSVLGEFAADIVALLEPLQGDPDGQGVSAKHDSRGIEGP